MPARIPVSSQHHALFLLHALLKLSCNSRHSQEAMYAYMRKNGVVFLPSRSKTKKETGPSWVNNSNRSSASHSRSGSIGRVLVIPLFFGVCAWCLLLFHANLTVGSSHDINAYIDYLSKQKSTNLNGSLAWYGWQPALHPDPDCKWRTCFHDNHGCKTTCRDEPEAMGRPPRQRDIPHDWVPDVTMLRRMFLAQQDANGNLWPPPLSTELCEPIGDSGDYNDQNKELLDAAPIIAEPLRGATTGPKILCMIYTVASAHAAQVRAIRETWAGGCDGFLAFSTESDPRIPAISIPQDGPESYDNMWQKVRAIWRFVDRHYADDFDFFILGGDDLFLLPQNLRSYLATVGSPDGLLYAGRRLAPDNLYNSGGAGYTLSRGTLKRFVKDGLQNSRCAPKRTTSYEDVMVAECLRLVLGISLADTRDDQGRERFHPFPPGWHYHWTPGNVSDWFYLQTKGWGVKTGAECCAPDSVSFHFIRKPAIVRHLFSLLYDANCRIENVDTRNKTASAGMFM